MKMFPILSGFSRSTPNFRLKCSDTTSVNSNITQRTIGGTTFIGLWQIILQIKYSQLTATSVGFNDGAGELVASHGLLKRTVGKYFFIGSSMFTLPIVARCKIPVARTVFVMSPHAPGPSPSNVLSCHCFLFRPSRW